MNGIKFFCTLLALSCLLATETWADICRRTPGIRDAIIEDLFRQTGEKLSCRRIGSEELSRVKHLKAQGLGLKALKPYDLRGLSELEHFDLSGNQLIEFPRGLFELTTLKSIDLTNNYLNGELPTEIGQFVNLEKLHLYNNKLKGRLPRKWETS